MRKSQRKLSQKEYDEAIRAYPTLQEKARKITKMALVDQAPYEEIAEKFGVSVQRVANVAKKVYQVALSQWGIPDTWEKVEVFLPPTQAKITREMAMEFLRAANESKDTKKPD